MIILETNFGNIGIELDFENTANTAQNFLDYVNAGFYDNTLFHRVIDNFMVQGGGFDLNFEEKESNGPIANEAENAQTNQSGTVAMARTSDPHSASSQFFINVKDNKFLDFKHSNSDDGWGYCVFGNVVEGIDVINKIKETETTIRLGHHDVPVEDVVIQKAYVQEKVETE